MRCKNCNKVLDKSFKLCPYCGLLVEEEVSSSESHRCPNCNEELQVKWTECPTCEIAFTPSNYCNNCRKELKPDWRICPSCKTRREPIVSSLYPDMVDAGDFFIGKYPVTFAQYDAFCEATGKEKPNDEKWGRGNRPVVNVNWLDAMRYCEWLSKETGDSYQLPTEEEWIFAARGGIQSRGFEFSGSNNLDEVTSLNMGCTQPVGLKKPNELGIYDMTGNVYEWCLDWQYKFEKQKSRFGGSYKSGLLGCYFVPPPKGLVNWTNVYHGSEEVGFRCLKIKNKLIDGNISSSLEQFSDNIERLLPEMVDVGDFYIGKYPVTFAQYDAFCDATGKAKPEDEGWGRENQPIMNVNWYDAVEYCEWLNKVTGKNFRLPTREECIFASQDAKISGSFKFRYCNYEEELGREIAESHPSKQKKYRPAIEEWCDGDFIESDENWKIICHLPTDIKLTNFEWPSLRVNWIGFRCARSK